MISFLSYLLFPAVIILVIGLLVGIFFGLPFLLRSFLKKSKPNNARTSKIWKKILKASAIIFILSLMIALANQYYIPRRLRNDFRNIVFNFKPQTDRIYLDSSLIDDPSFLLQEMIFIEEIPMNSSLSGNSVALTIEAQNRKLALDCIQDRDSVESFWLYFNVPNTRTRHPLGLIHSPELYSIFQPNDFPDN